MHNISNVFHEIRKNPDKNSGPAKLSWTEIERTVNEAGHPFCVVNRDNWSCQGNRYRNVLLSTAPYDPLLTLSTFPRGTRIFAHGNSYFAQKIATILCNSPADVWSFAKATHSNSLASADDLNDVALLMLSNHVKWDHDINETAVRLHAAAMTPDLILLGDINADARTGFDHVFPHERRAFWQGEFPHASVVEFPNKGTFEHRGWEVPKGCRADFFDCGEGMVHACMPGPISRVAEGMVTYMKKCLSGA